VLVKPSSAQRRCLRRAGRRADHEVRSARVNHH
jgi:hypothetical protein